MKSTVNNLDTTLGSLLCEAGSLANVSQLG